MIDLENMIEDEDTIFAPGNESCLNAGCRP